MWKIALLGTILGAAGWAVMGRVLADGRQHACASDFVDTNDEPENMVSMEEFRKRHFRQEGRPADALRVARAAVDLRMRNAIERDAA